MSKCFCHLSCHRNSRHACYMMLQKFLWASALGYQVLLLLCPRYLSPQARNQSCKTQITFKTKQKAPHASLCSRFYLEEAQAKTI